jgi:hypothetical protein
MASTLGAFKLVPKKNQKTVCCAKPATATYESQRSKLIQQSILIQKTGPERKKEKKEKEQSVDLMQLSVSLPS